jgi:sugar-specific transcriptional regulator TrmB
MKKTSPLTLLGLHIDEVTIYEELITRGPLSPTDICAYVKMHRPQVYTNLASLEGHSLVSVVPYGKRKKYVANSPKYLKDVSSRQEKLILDEIIRLEDIETPQGETPSVVVRQGQEALRQIYEDAVQELKKGEVYYRYLAIDTDKWVTGSYVTPKAIRIRNAKELERFIITNEDNKKRKAENPRRAIRLVPKKFDLFKHHIGQLMYSNKTAIFDYHNQTAVVIESGPITKFQIAIFKTLFHYL